jgi:hypothetical protein
MRVLRSGVALALLAPLLGFAACSSKTAATGMDGGTDGRGTTTHSSSSGKSSGGSADASCAVDAGPLQDAEVQLGLALVKAHNCFSCHGGALQGNDDGVSSTVEGGLAYPPNLTPDPGTGLGCWTNSQIKNAFLNGFDNQDAAICNPMPHFGHIAGEAGLDVAEATAVVQFLRSLPPLVNNVPSTPSCGPPVYDAGVVTMGPDATVTADAAKDAPVDVHHHDGARHDGAAHDAAHDDAEDDSGTHDGGAHDGGAHDGGEHDAAASDAGDAGK